MPITETTRHVDVSPPSSLRTELNIAAAVVAVGLCLLILALLANTPSLRGAHHPSARPHVHAPARALVAPRT
jgi:hypothetical protein